MNTKERFRWQFAQNTLAKDNFLTTKIYNKETNEYLLVEEYVSLAEQAKVKEVLEKMKPFIERIRLDVDVIVCDCGEKYKDSDLDLSVGELEHFAKENYKIEI